MSKVNSVNKKVVCSLLIALLATSLVLVTLMFDDPTLLANAKTVLDVEIKGLSKLGVNDPGQYVATVDGVADPTGSYVWTISPDDGKTTLTSTGYSCTVTFIEATLEPYLLSVTVSKAGAVGFDVFTLYDPVTLPDYHLSVASNPYNYMIAADGTGWYYVVNGTSGAVVTSGTNQTALEISTYAYGAGTVVLNQLQHNSSATVPATVTVIQNYQGTVTYIGNHVASNYASTQPMGDYTYMIYVDPTNSSLYNAKHSNGTICWTSTIYTNVLQDCVDSITGTGTIVNQLTGITYWNTTVTITYPQNIKLIGESITSSAGANFTTFVVNSAANPALLIQGPFHIENMNFYSEGLGRVGTGIYLSSQNETGNFPRGYMEGVSVLGFNKNFVFNSTQKSTFINCLSMLGNYGVYLEGPHDSEIAFVGCSITDNEVTGVFSSANQRGSAIEFIRCSIEANDLHGVHLVKAANMVFDDGCHFEANGGGTNSVFELVETDNIRIGGRFASTTIGETTYQNLCINMSASSNNTQISSKFDDGITTPVVLNGAVNAYIESLQHQELTASGDQTIPNNSWAKLNWTATGTSLGLLFSAATPSRITIPISGVYEVSVSVIFAANNSGYRGMYVYDGSSYIIPAQKIGAAAVDRTVISATVTKYLAAGSYLDVWVYQSSGGDLACSLYNANPFWSVTKIG